MSQNTASINTRLIDSLAQIVAIAFFPGQQPIDRTGEDILPVPKFLDLQLTVV